MTRIVGILSVRQLASVCQPLNSMVSTSTTVASLLSPCTCSYPSQFRPRTRDGVKIPNISSYPASIISVVSSSSVTCAVSASGLGDLVSSLTDTVSDFISDDALAPGLSGYQTRVNECNTGLERYPEFPPFIVDGKIVGYIHESFGKLLQPFTDVFRLSSHFLGNTPFPRELPEDQLSPGAEQVIGNAVVLNPNLKTAEERTLAIAQVLERLREEGHIPGWRNELYPVVPAHGKAPSFLVERAAAALFGIKCYGVHMNGYVRRGDGKKYLWVARRSPTKPTFPGMLDHLVAGGQPYGIKCADNLVKECWEEASIPEQLARQAVAVGAVSYRLVVNSTLKQDMLFCYDLLLPSDFVPENSDGEVAEFELKAIEEVAEIVRNTQEYKPNCTLVIIDFLVRHGYLTPDEPGYLTLVSSLRQGDCR